MGYPSSEKLPPYPEDIEGWVSLDRALASRCLRLRSKIRACQTVIDATVEYTPEDLDESVDEQAAAMGIEAWQLATDLHRKYRLDPDGGEYVPSLKETAAKVIKARDARRAARRSPSTDPRIGLG
jgi:hypothetical protein